MTDIHQSSFYSQFMQNIGWKVEKIDNINIFIKPFPIIGAFIKIQRSNKIPNIQKLKSLMKKYYAKRIIIEPNINHDLSKSFINHKSSILNQGYLPTKTIHIDLSNSENKIFNKFTDSKQRGIRKAQKNSVQIIQTNNIDDFIKLKNKSTGFLGFLTTKTIKPLWQIFSPKNAFCLVARLCHCEESDGRRSNLFKSIKRSPRPFGTRDDNEYIAGVLILIWQKTAYYWMATSTKIGNQYHAPSFLVWEALKESKKKGAIIFDFEGIYDERYLKLNREWLGFSKFKSGFGGTEIYFPKPFKTKLR